MTPERRAEVVEYLRDIADGSERGWHRVRTESTAWPMALREAADVLEAMGEAPRTAREEIGGAMLVWDGPPAPKSAEDSLRERVEGLEQTLRLCLTDLNLWISWSEGGHLRTEGPLRGENPVPEEWRALREKIRETLDGPSDPDRERETLAEVVKP